MRASKPKRLAAGVTLYLLVVGAVSLFGAGTRLLDFYDMQRGLEGRVPPPFWDLFFDCFRLVNIGVGFIVLLVILIAVVGTLASDLFDTAFGP